LYPFPKKGILIIFYHFFHSPYWYQLDNRTGGDHSIKYTILDPYIPWFCIRDYFESDQQIRLSEMQKAINKTLRYTVDIIDEVLTK